MSEKDCNRFSKNEIFMQIHVQQYIGKVCDQTILNHKRFSN